ncbi:MAG: exodeoxyribonuclease VII small subunit [Lachnospiraceae bacterium]|nr:exodeoxyribonuclease VII small subunit [Lachnospiraceae bacterium]
MEEKAEDRVEEMKGAESPGLEELFLEIEDIITKMEDREVSLEQSFLLYEAGMKKLKQCNEKIDYVEKKMLALNSDGTTSEFE